MGLKYLEYDRERLVGPPVCGEDGAEDVRSSGPDELGRVVGVDHGEERLHPGPVSRVGGHHAGAGLQSPGLDPPLGVGFLLLLIPPWFTRGPRLTCCYASSLMP